MSAGDLCGSCEGRERCSRCTDGDIWTPAFDTLSSPELIEAAVKVFGLEATTKIIEEAIVSEFLKTAGRFDPRDQPNRAERIGREALVSALRMID